MNASKSYRFCYGLINSLDSFPRVSKESFVRPVAETAEATALCSRKFLPLQPNEPNRLL